jgi:anti-anti-sigma regulatory factor
LAKGERLRRASGQGVDVGIGCEKGDGLTLVRIEGAIDIASAAELKAVLLEALTAPGDVRIDAGQAAYFDITAMQLLWAAEREAKKLGVGFGSTDELPAPVRAGLREAGFDAFPLAGESIQAKGERG